jgi:hypothetical protein
MAKGLRFDLAEYEEGKRIVAAIREAAWLAEMDAMSERDEGLCYFAGTDLMVKIGFSRDVHTRIEAVRREVGLDRIQLFATVRGGKYRETYYHQKFAEHRIAGEWFRSHPDLLAEIERLGAGAS